MIVIKFRVIKFRFCEVTKLLGRKCIAPKVGLHTGEPTGTRTPVRIPLAEACTHPEV